MELSDLQKRVEALEGLTNQLAQWVGFSIQEELKGRETMVKDESEKEVGANKGRGRKRKGRRRGGVEKKSGSRLRKKKLEATEDDYLMNYDDNTNFNEYSEKEDTIGDPDFEADVDLPLILPTSGLDIKEEQDSDFDEYIKGGGGGDSLSFPSSSMVATDKEEDNISNGCSPVSEPLEIGESSREPYSLRKRNRPQPWIQWNCRKCPEVFGKRKEYYQHLHQVHPTVKWEGPLICPHCPEEKRKPFKSAFFLQAHIRIHTGETPFACPSCGKGFKTNVQLKSHISFIHPEKPRETFKCNKCGRLLATEKLLQLHMQRMHADGGNPFAVQCDKCNIVYSSKSSLRTHVRAIHENIRNFACELCGQLFKKNYVLKQHLERHKNPKMKKRGPELVPRARGKPVPSLEPKDNDIQNQSEFIGNHEGPLHMGMQSQLAIPGPLIPVATAAMETERLNLRQSSSPIMNATGTMGEFSVNMMVQSQEFDGCDFLS